MSKHYLEFSKKYKNDFLRTRPCVFDNPNDGPADFCVADMYGSLYYEGHTDEKPIYYFRHSNPDSYRFGGFIELGDDYLMPQKGGYHIDDVAQKDALVSPYQKVSDNPISYEIRSEEPYSDYKFFADHAEFQETSIFHAKATPLPITIIDHSSIFPPMNQISQPCRIDGVYEGKKVTGLGSYDRYFMPGHTKKDFSVDLGYICATGVGLREDGKYEVVIVTISDNGQQCGMYWVEGKEPIVSDHVILKTIWHRLPYVDDGTCIYHKAQFEFANIVLHVEGKWGTKGFTKKPRVERHGQSQVFGSWYVGNKPYKHKLSSSFMENMNCYDYLLRQRGFEVEE